MRSARPEDRGIWYVVGAIAFLGGLLLRLQLATLAQTPGHGDSAFYYTVATNIVDGRGLVVDYVVYFFLGLVPITHYAGDFWNPLAEILLSLPMLVLGKSVFNALLASIAAGIVPAAVGFFFGRRFGGSVMTGVLTGILTWFSPFLILVSVLTEAIIFYGAFGSLALYLMIKGRTEWRYFLMAAVCTGLAHLVRQDGVLLLVTLLACAAFAPISLRSRLAAGSAALVLHALVISPMLSYNLNTYGTLIQPGPSKTAFMTSYEDFHSYGKELSWGTLRAEWGLRGILARRLHTAGENLANVKFFIDPFLLFAASLGVVNLVLTRVRGIRWSDLLPPLLYSILVFAFYTAVASFSGPGSLPKSLAVVLPFVCVLVVDLAASRLRSLPVVAAAVLLMSVFLGARGYERNASTARFYNELYEDYGRFREIVESDIRRQGLAADAVVVMSRDVWDVYAATGFKGVMIPNNDLETILFVADHYDADYMLLPAPRPALEDIYLGTTPDARLQLLAGVPGTDWKIFRIELDGN